MNLFFFCLFIGGNFFGWIWLFGLLGKNFWVLFWGKFLVFGNIFGLFGGNFWLFGGKFWLGFVFGGNFWFGFVFGGKLNFFCGINCLLIEIIL